MAPILRPLNPACDQATKHDRRDFRVFWTHSTRDAKGVKWSGGERRARKRFARLIAGGKLARGEAVAEAIKLRTKARPSSWTEESWAKYWSASKLRLIADRWLLHPFVQDEAKRQKKIAAAQAALRAGLPDEVLSEIAQSKEYSARDRAMAAMGMAKLADRHAGNLTPDFTEDQRDAARKSLEESAPKQAEEDADGPSPG